jgi:hypothetical protein
MPTRFCFFLYICSYTIALYSIQCSLWLKRKFWFSYFCNNFARFFVSLCEEKSDEKLRNNKSFRDNENFLYKPILKKLFRIFAENFRNFLLFSQNFCFREKEKSVFVSTLVFTAYLALLRPLTKYSFG